MTGTTKEMIAQIVTNELQKLSKMLDQMEPKERFDATIKLLAFIVPKGSIVEEKTSQSIVNEPMYRKFLVQQMNNPVSGRFKV